MSPDPVSPDALMKDAGTGDAQEIARNRRLTKPRPGHADLVGMNKYGFDDARLVLERASARETAARVAAGAVASERVRKPENSRYPGGRDAASGGFSLCCSGRG